jgi:hypothetical protein
MVRGLLLVLLLAASVAGCVARSGFVDFPACIINCHASVSLNQPQPQPTVAASGVPGGASVSVSVSAPVSSPVGSGPLPRK